MTTTTTPAAGRGEVGPDESGLGGPRPPDVAGSTPSGPPSDAEWTSAESWPAFPPPAAVPVPVLAPYLGLVAAVLCTLGGGWLLLAPYALDIRHGATRLPRTAAVELGTGAAIIAVGVVATVLFSMNLASRLRADLAAEPEEDTPAAVAEPEAEAVREPAPAAVPGARSKEADPGGALRELLTPLVAALAADLRSHDQERTREQQQERQQQEQQERQRPQGGGAYPNPDSYPYPNQREGP